MKEKDLYIEFKPHEMVMFVEKDDESYGPIISGSHISKHYLEDSFKMKKNLDLKLRERMKKGEISPVYYYMLMQEMGEGDLAKRVGVSKRALKKHFRPRYFNELKLSTIKRYADVFDVNVAMMFQILLVRQEDADKLKIDMTATENPCLFISKIELK